MLINPEPIPENLTQIAAKMKESRADLGIVVDPDVDRLAFDLRERVKCSVKSIP